MIERNLEIPLTGLKKELENLFVVADENVFALYKQYLPQHCYILGSGESQKTLNTVERICEELLARGAGRQTQIAAVGGGVTGDIAGFAASVYMRGIDWVNVPTTITAMADSAIGGKTGVNLSGRKNIIGAFNSPKKVYYCYEFLNTLPKKESDSGYVEIIKTAILNKPTFLLINKGAKLKELIKSCVKFKQKIVKSDLYDRGKRRMLNLGHTIGHALELLYSLSHGEAVAMGLMAECAIIQKTDKTLLKWIDKQTKPFFKPIQWDAGKILQAVKNDKKNSDKGIGLAFACRVGKTGFITIAQEEFLEKLTGYIESL